MIGRLYDEGLLNVASRIGKLIFNVDILLTGSFLCKGNLVKGDIGPFAAML